MAQIWPRNGAGLVAKRHFRARAAPDSAAVWDVMGPHKKRGKKELTHDFVPLHLQPKEQEESQRLGLRGG